MDINQYELSSSNFIGCRLEIWRRNLHIYFTKLCLNQSTIQRFVVFSWEINSKTRLSSYKKRQLLALDDNNRKWENWLWSRQRKSFWICDVFWTSDCEYYPRLTENRWEINNTEHQEKSGSELWHFPYRTFTLVTVKTHYQHQHWHQLKCSSVLHKGPFLSPTAHFYTAMWRFTTLTDI